MAIFVLKGDVKVQPTNQSISARLSQCQYCGCKKDEMNN